MVFGPCIYRAGPHFRWDTISIIKYSVALFLKSPSRFLKASPTRLFGLCPGGYKICHLYKHSREVIKVILYGSFREAGHAHRAVRGHVAPEFSHNLPFIAEVIRFLPDIIVSLLGCLIASSIVSRLLIEWHLPLNVASFQPIVMSSTAILDPVTCGHAKEFAEWLPWKVVYSLLIFSY